MRAIDLLEYKLLPADISLDDELNQMGDDAVVEMANLDPAHTGVQGFIFISTAMGSHGARVKYFVNTGRKQKSFSVLISPEPKVVANSLPERVRKKVEPQVLAKYIHA